MRDKQLAVTRSKNNLAETGLRSSVFLISFTANRYGKRLSAKQFLLPPLHFIEARLTTIS